MKKLVMTRQETFLVMWRRFFDERMVPEFKACKLSKEKIEEQDHLYLEMMIEFIEFLESQVEFVGPDTKIRLAPGTEDVLLHNGRIRLLFPKGKKNPK